MSQDRGAICVYHGHPVPFEMTIAPRAMQNGDQSARCPQVRLNRAAGISRRARAFRTNELSGGEDDDEGNSDLLQSPAYGSSSIR